MTPEALAAAARDRLPGARCESASGSVTLEVSPAGWRDALRCARDELDCDFFDWLTAVDEGERGFTVVVHVYSLAGRHHLLVRTQVSRSSPALASVTGIYRGADWHEREAHEMFGVVFDGHPNLAPLLLPEGFDGHPLRKDFVLAPRVDKEWPGGREPGEGEDRPARRRLRPPGIPEEWGPR